MYDFSLHAGAQDIEEALHLSHQRWWLPLLHAGQLVLAMSVQSVRQNNQLIKTIALMCSSWSGTPQNEKLFVSKILQFKFPFICGAFSYEKQLIRISRHE